MLKHFCSNNAYAYRREKASKIVPAGDGELKISGGGCDEYIRPKTVQDCQNALNNYRSALQRIWPWDWTAEVSRAKYYVNFPLPSVIISGHDQGAGGLRVVILRPVEPGEGQEGFLH